MSVEAPEVAAPVERRSNGVTGKVLGVLGCIAAAGAIVGAIYNDRQWAGVQADHTAAQQEHQRCAEYVGTLTEERKERPIVRDALNTLTASVISDCKVPGKPADFYSDPTDPNSTIETVALPSLEFLESAAQTQERKAVVAGRSVEGMERDAGIGALVGAGVGGAGVTWLVRRRRPARNIE